MSFVLGDAFSGHIGRDLGHLIVYLSPWVVVAVAFSVTFPLLFVLEKPATARPAVTASASRDTPSGSR